jgi:large subunit ribosomal protein L23
MATTKTKKNTQDKIVEAKVVKSSILLSPRITEKSALASEKGAYTFNVSTSATKSEIKKAIKAQYSVTPVKVSVTQITDKVVMRRGVLGTKSGGKKAVVYLKKGDKIAFT